MPVPTEAMAKEASRGLEWRKEHGRGGTEIGVARARDISNRKDLSDETVARMRSYFARHEVDKRAEGFRPGEDGYPSAGRIAWALWGGDPGQSWANAQAEGEKMESKSIKLDIKASSEGVIEGYASRFGEIDSVGDVLVKGAFADSLRERKVSMLWQHDMTQPIGVWNELAEDDNGLYAKGKILDKVEKGREALALIEEGALDGLSIGFRIKPDGREYNEEGHRLIKSVDLFEISLVTFPALNSARIDAIKAAEMTERDMERLLMQDAGLSRSVARLLMSGGLDAVKAKQDAGEGGFCELVQFMREHNMQ